jgi:3-deoxy-7-phosphoheptulonate synthase
MLLILQADANEQDTQKLVGKLATRGITSYPTQNGGRQVVALSQSLPLDVRNWLYNDCPVVEKMLDIKAPYKLASVEYKSTPSVFNVGDVQIGGGNFVVMAGPCTIESEKQLFETASLVKQAGANILRGGAFKPRTSPYSFQGMGVEGLKLLRRAGHLYGLPTVTEVMEPAYVEAVAEYADIIQIGARNMQNFPLLREAGLARKPVLLKRGPANTLEEWLLSAEYILSGGNEQVILCERGIKSFDQATRNCLDLGGVAAVMEKTHLPVIVDPSHATGKRSLVSPLALAAAAMGVGGVIVEVHPHPEQALCDGAQSLLPAQLETLVRGVHSVSAAAREAAEEIEFAA